MPGELPICNPANLLANSPIQQGFGLVADYGTAQVQSRLWRDVAHTQFVCDTRRDVLGHFTFFPAGGADTSEKHTHTELGSCRMALTNTSTS